MKARIGQNPEFATITVLTNRNFNPASITEGQMITEAQMLEVYERIVADEKKADACCRDILFWETHTQIVRMNTVDISAYNALRGGGVVVSPFEDNVRYGTMRRGLPYTVTFPVKWDGQLYVPRNTGAASRTNCAVHAGTNEVHAINRTFLQYRATEDVALETAGCQPTDSNYAQFWYGTGLDGTLSDFSTSAGRTINSQNIWVNFIYEIKEDGTVAITDNRRKTDFSVIRFYTQWILRLTGDGQTIPDPE